MIESRLWNKRSSLCEAVNNLIELTEIHQLFLLTMVLPPRRISTKVLHLPHPQTPLEMRLRTVMASPRPRQTIPRLQTHPLQLRINPPFRNRHFTRSQESRRTRISLHTNATSPAAPNLETALLIIPRPRFRTNASHRTYSSGL